MNILSLMYICLISSQQCFQLWRHFSFRSMRGSRLTYDSAFRNFELGRVTFAEPVIRLLLSKDSGSDVSMPSIACPVFRILSRPSLAFLFIGRCLAVRMRVSVLKLSIKRRAILDCDRGRRTMIVDESRWMVHTCSP